MNLFFARRFFAHVISFTRRVYSQMSKPWLLCWVIGESLLIFHPTPIGVVGGLIFISLAIVSQDINEFFRRIHGKYRTHPQKNRPGTTAGQSPSTGTSTSPSTPAKVSRASLKLFGNYPLAIGEVYGIRRWNIRMEHEVGYLLPVHQAGYPSWHSELNIAICTSHYTHLPPNETCGCGFYAYNKASQLTYMSGAITGVIAGSGRTLQGTRGFRCQKARIVALVDPRTIHLGRKSDYLALRWNYPEVPVFKSVRKMLKAFPLTPPPDFED